MSEALTLAAAKREGRGKSAAKALRAEGRLPGVVYAGGEDAVSVSVDFTELEEILSTEYQFNVVFGLAIEGGDTVTVMLKDRQFDPVRRELTHVDFYRVTPEHEVVINVPVATTGTSKGVKAGGRLLIVSRTVKVRCQVRDIPAYVYHDVTDVEIAESVYVDEMTPPEGCTFEFKNRFPVIRVARKRGARLEEEAEEAAAAAPGEAPAPEAPAAEA